MISSKSRTEQELPTVSVIIPVYRDWERLQSCLDALEAQRYPKDRLELLVINNDPGDDSPFEPDSVNLRLLDEAVPGSYAARNRGIREATGDILAFTDSDCIPDVDWIKSGVTALLENPSIHRVAGRVELFFRSDRLNWVEIYEKAFAFPQEEYVRSEKFGVTANMFAWRDVFEKVGYFNPDLYSGGDLEWGQRADRHGYRISYAENAVVRHPARTKISDLLRKNRRAMGGWYRRNRSNRRAVSSIMIRLLLPPVQGGKRVCKNSNLRVREKLIAIAVYCVLKLHSFITIFKLLFQVDTFERR
ncbi:MAG: glycosyltransferase [Bacteroidota bacterium]